MTGLTERGDGEARLGRSRDWGRADAHTHGKQSETVYLCPSSLGRCKLHGFQNTAKSKTQWLLPTHTFGHSHTNEHQRHNFLLSRNGGTDDFNNFPGSIESASVSRITTQLTVGQQVSCPACKSLHMESHQVCSEYNFKVEHRHNIVASGMYL